jgi:tetratricopeptide (TPR) repeat protein
MLVATLIFKFAPTFHFIKPMSAIVIRKLSIYGLILFCLFVAIQSQAQEKADTLKVRQLVTRLGKLRDSYPDSIPYLAEKGFTLARSIDDKMGVADLNNLLGIYYWVKGDYLQAINHYNESLALNNEIKNYRGTAKSLVNLGMVYSQLGDNAKAIDFFLNGLKVAESNDYKFIIATATNSLGVVYKNTLDFRNALIAYQRSWTIYKELHALTEIAGVYSNIGQVEFLLGNTEKATDYYKKALHLFDSLNIFRGKVICYNQISEVLLQKKDYNEALRYSEMALAMSRSQGFGEHEILSLKGLGKISYSRGQFEQSIKFLEEGVRLARQKKYSKHLVALYKDLSESYRAASDFKEALLFHEQYSALKDSIFNDQSRISISNMQIRYELGKKEQEALLENDQNRRITYFTIGFSLALVLILLLIYRNTSIKNTVTTIKLKSEFQEKLSKTQIKALQSQMNPHFIFNCLNSIDYFILKSMPSAASDYLGKFSKLMRLFMEEMKEEMTLLSKENLALQLYLELEKLRFGKKLSYLITVDNGINSNEYFIPSMIIQPFVENAIIHGVQPLPNGGTVSIQFIKSETATCCVIEDNGVGREYHRSKNNKEKRKSYGMNLSIQRLKLLQPNSSIEILDLYDEQKNPIGTRVVIKFADSIEE